MSRMSARRKPLTSDLLNPAIKSGHMVEQVKGLSFEAADLLPVHSLVSLIKID